MNKLTDIFNPNVRKWIYDISMAVIPLLVITGLLTNEVAGQVMVIVAAVLGFSSNLLARANVNPQITDSVTTDEFKG